ncbi:unnamed protein product [Arabidopsis thaliana]|nr:unnamed protein product [Arabidopsis thaliana]
MSQSLDHQNSCHDNLTVNVPLSFFPEERELSLTHLESGLRNGLEVKLVIDKIPCQQCSPTGGIVVSTVPHRFAAT